MEDSDRHAQIEGCLLGCAAGDSIGLPYEGLKPRRLSKWITRPLHQSFLFHRGMISDDTDHSIFVAQALAKCPTDPDSFSRFLAMKFRLWLLCLPAGIGMATLKSILKLWLGFRPSRSGVFSAGNGAAMRSAIIGTYHSSNPELRKRFVTASTLITHSDPKADFGAQAIAALAAHLTVGGTSKPSIEQLRNILSAISEEAHWIEVVDTTLAACTSGDIEDAIIAGANKEKGISGYIYHTMPVAIAAWYIHFGDFRATIESVVILGGDTDTVAAIAGSLAGITVQRAGIPQEWVTGIIDHPHSPQFIRQLSEALNKSQSSHSGFSWLLFPRGIIFTSIVLLHGFRRLFPPY